MHTIIFDLITTDNKIIKVGQYPSVADMTIPEIKKYRKVLGSEYRDYAKAIGLFANGIGIGSFVYLRRIIENLIYKKFKYFLYIIRFFTFSVNLLSFLKESRQRKFKAPRSCAQNIF